MTVNQSERLLYDWCETQYGYAFIACSPLGIRNLDLFETKRELMAHRASRTLLKHGVAEPQDALCSTIKMRLKVHQPLEDLPLDITGTSFQRLVWSTLQTIPIGTTCSYRDLACLVGVPNACRAVANACARNTVALVIPCHRVVRGDNSLGGYRWGALLKERLLVLEQEATQKSLVSSPKVR